VTRTVEFLWRRQSRRLRLWSRSVTLLGFALVMHRDAQHPAVQRAMRRQDRLHELNARACLDWYEARERRELAA
jgi:hypothetical protein